MKAKMEYKGGELLRWNTVNGICYGQVVRTENPDGTVDMSVDIGDGHNFRLEDVEGDNILLIPKELQ